MLVSWCKQELLLEIGYGTSFGHDKSRLRQTSTCLPRGILPQPQFARDESRATDSHLDDQTQASRHLLAGRGSPPKLQLDKSAMEIKLVLLLATFSFQYV